MMKPIGCCSSGKRARDGRAGGGKIEAGEDALSALRRGPVKEIGLTLRDENARPRSLFASAANQPDAVVEAELFHLRIPHVPRTQAEIAEAVWVNVEEAAALPLAPLTRDVVLPLSRMLR